MTRIGLGLLVVIGVALLSCGGGGGNSLGGAAVTATGSPANNNMTCFSGAMSITDCNLSSDATTSGTSAVTVVGVHPTTTEIADASSPYAILSSDTVVYCNGSSGSITLDLPAATGSDKLFILSNISTTEKCTIAPIGTDKIGATNASFTLLRAENLPMHLLDEAPGQWQVLGGPATYDNFGFSLYGEADISVGSSDTLIFSAHLPAFTTNALDMVVNGQVEFTYTGASAGSVVLKVALWSNNNTDPKCQMDLDIPVTGTGITRPFTCASFNSAPALGTLYYTNIYASTTLTGVTAKYLDVGGNHSSSFCNMVINATF